MAHEHSHGEGGGSYFVDQLFTILSCASFGVVGILLYQMRDKAFTVLVEGARIRVVLSEDLLSPEFWPWVVSACVGVLALTLVRAVDVWRAAGALAHKHAETESTQIEAKPHVHDENCGHDHSHSHAHSHGHDHAHTDDCGHDHSQDHAHSHAAHADTDEEVHDHGWSPWKYMVLAAPIFLSLFLAYGGMITLLAQFKYDKMRREGLAMDRDSAGSLSNPKRDGLALLAGGVVKSQVLKRLLPVEMNLRFKELSDIAAIPMNHEDFEGQIGIIRGQYWPLSRGTGNEFQLFRQNITCCGADAVILQIRIVAPEPVQGIKQGQWVQVKGVISFARGPSGWVGVITLDSNEDINQDVEPTNDVEGT